jgi:SAM-dependent methyltransferase
VIAELGLQRSGEVVDLAAGTGKLTRALVPRFARVVAIEPDEEMRAFLAQNAPTAETMAGRAEAMPLPDASVDAVFVADAFHWFDTRVALDEIARVLRPRGGLAFLWNVWRELEPRLPQHMLDRLWEIHARAGRRTGPSYDAGPWCGEWRKAMATSQFEPLGAETLETDVHLSEDDVTSLYLTVSSVTALEEPERRELAESLRRSLSGRYRLRLRTDVYWTRLRSR